MYHNALRAPELQGSRRGFIAVFLVSWALLLAVPWSATQCAEPGGQIILSGRGAEWEENMRKWVIAPFEKKFNAKVIHDPQGTASEKAAKIRAAKGQYLFDLGVTTAANVFSVAKEGLLEKVDESKIPEMKNLYEIAQTYGRGYGPVTMFEPLVLVYHKGKVSPAPDSWEVLWDKKYKGKVGISLPHEGKGRTLLEIAAYLKGGSEKNIDPGFEKIRQLVPNVGFWLTEESQYVPYIERGELWLAPWWNGRAQVYKSQGVPIEVVFPKEGTLATNNIWMIPKSARNKDLAHKFLNFYLEVEQQKAWAENMFYSPTNKNVKLSPEVASRVIYGAEAIAKLRLEDPDVVAMELPKWIERWNKEIQAALKSGK